MAERLHLAAVYAQIQFARKRQLPQRPGIRVYDLHKLGVVSRQPERFRSIKLDEGLGRIQADDAVLATRQVRGHHAADVSAQRMTDACDLGVLMADLREVCVNLWSVFAQIRLRYSSGYAAHTRSEKAHPDIHSLEFKVCLSTCCRIYSK